MASAAAIFKHLDRARYEAVPIRIEKDGRWALAGRAPTAISAAEVIEQARVQPARALRPGRDTCSCRTRARRRSSPSSGGADEQRRRRARTAPA